MPASGGSSNGSFDFYITGLGNPGGKYENTRHNLGFRLIDLIASSVEDVRSVTPSAFKGKAECLQASWCGRKVLLIKPLTFMNNSGEPLSQILRWYRADIANQLLVVYDDLDIPLGSVRLRAKGSAGTHNGMDSVVSCLGNGDFARLRLGIGPKPEQRDAADFVLGSFSKQEKTTVDEMLEKAKKILETVLTQGLQVALSSQSHG